MRVEQSANPESAAVTEPVADGYAILSDCHGNSPALHAVLEDVDRRGFRNILFLGDAVNGVDPAACLELLREREVRCIRGNAEECVCTANVPAFPWRIQANLCTVPDAGRSVSTITK